MGQFSVLMGLLLKVAKVCTFSTKPIKSVLVFVGPDALRGLFHALFAIKITSAVTEDTDGVIMSVHLPTSSVGMLVTQP